MCAQNSTNRKLRYLHNGSTDFDEIRYVDVFPLSRLRQPIKFRDFKKSTMADGRHLESRKNRDISETV